LVVILRLDKNNYLRFVAQLIKQEAQLSQRGRATFRVGNFAKLLMVIQNYTAA